MYFSHGISKVFVLMSALVFLNACTRSEKENTVTSFSIPVKMTRMLKGDSSTVKRLDYTLSYIAINITGPSLTPIFCAFDLKHYAARGPCKFSDPTSDGQVSVSVEVTNGDSRLFQVVTANEDMMSINGSMVFYYADNADKLASLSGANTSVSLQLGELNNGTSQSGGHIAGRYITGGSLAAPTGPTGLLEIKVKAKDGKPSVTIQQTEMFAGWFQAFGLEFTPFEYLVNGQKLFGKPVNKADFISMAAVSSASIAVATDAGGSGEYKVAGFFAANTALNNLIVGRVAVASGSCSAVVGKTAFENCISFQDRFQGPFKSVDSSGAMLGFSGAAPSPTTISWAFLPGVFTADNSVIDGVTILQVSQDLNPDLMEGLILDRGFNCEGYRKTAGIVTTDVPVSITSKQFTAGLDPNLMSMRPLAVCPRKGSILYTSAITEPNFNDDGPGGGSQGPYLRVQLNMAQSQMDSYLVAKNGCYPLDIYSFEGYGNPFPVSQEVNFLLSAPSWAEFYYTWDCTGGAAPQPVALIMDPANNSTSSGLYLKIVGSPSIDNMFQLTGYEGLGDGLSFQPNYNKVNIAMPQYVFQMPSTVVQNVCYQGELKVDIPGGSGWGFPNSGNGGQKPFHLAANLSEVAVFTNPGDCVTNTNPASTLDSMVSTSSTGFIFYYKKIAVGTHNLSVSDLAESIYATLNFPISTGTGSSSPQKIRVTSPNNMELGGCYPYLFESVNENGVVVPAISNLVVDIEATDFGVFYSDGSCMSMEAYSVNINPGQTSGNLFFKPERTSAGYSIVFSGTNNIEPTGIVSRPIAYPSTTGPSGGLYFEIVNPPKYPHSKSLSFATIIGSHQFPYLFNFNSPSGATVTCTTDGGATWGTCGGRLNSSAHTFSMEFGDVINSGAWVKVENTNGQFYTFPINTIFKNAEFRNCDYVQATGTTFDFLNTDSSVLAATNVCFNGVVLSKGGGTANSIMATSSKYYIGYIDFNTGLNSTSITPPASYPGVDISSITSAVNVANINFNLGMPAAVGIGNTSNPSSMLISTNNKYFSGSANNYTGIQLSGTGQVALVSRMDSFVINANSTGATGISLNQASHGIYNGKFVLTSTASNLAKGISLVAPTSITTINLTLDHSEFSGSGNFVYVEGDNTNGFWPNISIMNTRLDNINSNPLGYSIYLKNKIALNMSDSVLSHSGPTPSVKFFQDNLNGTQFVNIHGTRLVNGTDQPAISVFASVSSGSVGNYDLSDNQFVKTVGATASAIDLNVNSGAGSVAIRIGSTAGHGNNLFCGLSGGSTWANVNTGNAITATGTQLIPPAIVNTANSTSKMCTHKN